MAELLHAVYDASSAPMWGSTFEDVPSPFALYSDNVYQRWLLAAGLTVRDRDRATPAHARPATAG